MNVDPIIEEIRAGRREHASRFHYDLKAICDDFRQREREVRDRLVSPPPKRNLKNLEIGSRGKR